jgi:hypothetical protein
VPLDAVGSVLAELRGAPIPPTEVRAFTASMDAADDAGCVTFEHFIAAFARQPLRDIPLEHDLDAILCGELVACTYELMGLLPPRSAAVYGSTPPVRGASMSECDTPSHAGTATTARAVQQDLSAGAPPAYSVSPGSGRGAATAGVGGAGPAASSRRGSQQQQIPLGEGAGRPPLSPDVTWGLHQHRSTRSSGSTGGTGSHSLRGSLVIVDAAVADFRHFTPVSFSTLHKPRLQLLFGRLEPEEAVEVEVAPVASSSRVDEREFEGKHEVDTDGRSMSGLGSARAAGLGLTASAAASLAALTAGTALQDPAARPSSAAATAARAGGGTWSGGGRSSSRASPSGSPESASARAPRLEESSDMHPLGSSLAPLRIVDGPSASSRGVLSTPMAISRGRMTHDPDTAVAIDVRGGRSSDSLWGTNASGR